MPPSRLHRASFPSDGAKPSLSDGAQPLHIQVRKAVSAEIAAGRLAPGNSLPSERSLCEALNVSRVTVRRALRELVEDGLVESVPGKGWFVASGPLSEPPNTLLSFSTMGRARGLEPTARVLTRRVRPATLDEAEALGVTPGAEIFELERLRNLDGLPVSVDCSRIPLSRVPELVDIDWTRESLYARLKLSGIVPSQADYTLEAGEADDRFADLLGVTPGKAVLVATQTTYDQGGHPIELGRAVFRGDRYRFRGRLSQGREWQTQKLRN